MKARTLVWTLPLVLALVAAVPTVGAHSAPVTAGPVAPATIPAPITGTVTNCTSTLVCKFAFNTSAGTGWAYGQGVSVYTAGVFSFQLPGEANASYGLTYSTYIGSLTGTYTYWVVGTFLGTDVNTGKVVYGTTDTNYTITCHGHSGRGGGCTYTYTTDNGTIVLKFTNAEQTTTVWNCSSTFTHPGAKVSCTITVKNDWNASYYPKGKVHLSNGRTGTFSNKGVCVLTNGSCSFSYRAGDNACGAITLYANYPGTPLFYKSAASIAVDVYVNGGC